MSDDMDEETMLLAKSQGSYIKLEEILAHAEHDNEPYASVRTADLRNVMAHFRWLAETRLLELMYQSFSYGDDDDD